MGMLHLMARNIQFISQAKKTTGLTKEFIMIDEIHIDYKRNKISIWRVRGRVSIFSSYPLHTHNLVRVSKIADGKMMKYQLRIWGISYTID